MRLYRTPSGAWRGTQAEASATSQDEGAHRLAFVEVDVPTDKPSLLDRPDVVDALALIAKAGGRALLRRAPDFYDVHVDLATGAITFEPGAD